MLPYSELELQHLTWTDVTDRLAGGYRTVVFAAGATEQHGPHMPLAVDALLGTAIARRVATALGNALVAPTIRPGFSPHHMDFPGTLTLRQSTLTAIIVDYCTSLAVHGFDTLVVLSSHGGNNAIVKMAAQEAQAAVGEHVAVIPVTDLMSYWGQPYDRRLEGYHATRLETSCVLSVRPDLVHMERARDWDNPIPPDVRDVSALLGLRPVKFFAPDGTMGLPTGADAELGNSVLDAIGRNVAAQVNLIAQSIRANSPA
jgi:creatinine amidohydrolase